MTTKLLLQRGLLNMTSANRHPEFPLSLGHCLIGYVTINKANAEAHPRKIIADSVETHSLSVVNPYGKQGVEIHVGDTGFVTLDMLDTQGRESISLLTTPSPEPSICLGYKGKCRIAIGDVYRGDQRQMSIQLRAKDGKTVVWMPETTNPFTPDNSPR